MINLIAEVAGAMATQDDDWAQWAYPLTAMVAIHAAKEVRHWGHDAARRYALNRGVPARMFEIANEFENRRVKHGKD